MEAILKKYTWVINLLVITIGTFFIAKTINGFVGSYLAPKSLVAKKVKPKMSSKRQRYISKKSYKSIIDRNIFDSTNALKALQAEEKDLFADRPKGDLVKSSIKATLLGTIVTNFKEFSIATINYKDKTQPYVIGEKLEDATIVEIERKRVILNRDGQLEYIASEDRLKELEQEKAVASTRTSSQKGGIYKKSENEFEIAREKLDATLADMNNVLKQARAVPYIVNGQTQGFKIFAIRPRSVYRELGIRNGDIIERVNTQDLNSIESVLEMFQTLKSDNSFTIDLKRRGKKQTFTYEVK